MEPPSRKFKVRSVCGTGERSGQEIGVWVGGSKVMSEPWSAEGVRKEGERTPGQDSGGLRCARTRQQRSHQTKTAAVSQRAQGRKKQERGKGQLLGLIGDE